jgi:hypothetical protein
MAIRKQGVKSPIMRMTTAKIQTIARDAVTATSRADPNPHETSILLERMMIGDATLCRG